ncbi:MULTISPECIES: hypothetical protein [unclassified Rathayibacter]|uniref:hypothetical protein n=1 Tax=unclassified Rathayibacter TaxID=2609250 RepID=UPI001404F8A8|nr:MULTISPECIES: hypothetical protein [unclassified Rathayibacter]
MSTTHDTTDGLGTDGTIPNSPDGLAVGYDPNGSHFNPEEDATTTPDGDTGDTDVDALPDGSGTDAESSIEDDDDTDTASGGDAD